jgi:hypothetical protein
MHAHSNDILENRMNQEGPIPAADDGPVNPSGGLAARSTATATELAITAHTAAAETLMAILKPAIAVTVADTDADYQCALAAASGAVGFASNPAACHACAGTGIRIDRQDCSQCHGTGSINPGAAGI